MSVKQRIARTAVRSTAKHSAHRAAARLRRHRLRTTTLLAVGAVIGASLGWLARGHGSGDAVGEVA